MKLTMFVAAVAVANVRGHGGVNRDFVRKEKLSKHQPHLKSVTDRPQGGTITICLTDGAPVNTYFDRHISLWERVHC